jgi:hypothetical protein
MQSRYETEIKELMTSKEDAFECQHEKFRLQILEERLQQFVFNH